MSASDREPTPTSPVKPRRNLTPKQWAEAEAMWEAGGIIYEDLANKFGGYISTFERHFKKKGIVKGSKAVATKKRVEEKLAVIAIDDATVMAARIKETKEEHYKMASALARLTWNEILEAKKKGAPVAVALANLKALDTAMNVLKKAREERYSVLGLDRPDAVDPDELPELVISELTAQQVQELRDRDHTELDGPDEVMQEGDDDITDEDDE